MYRIPKDQCVYSLGAEQAPALTVPSGSEVVFETHDCFQSQIQRENQSVDTLNWDQINPATGPLFVEEAMPGDVLKIEILGIEIGEQGVMAVIPGAGLLGDSIKKSQIKVMPIKDGCAEFNKNLNLPVTPTIGVIGVAPSGNPVPCGSPGPHGGNMDNGKTRAGTILYLPVFTEGGLLSIGDLHGLIGDGEIMISGLEVGGSVHVRVTVQKDESLENPVLENETHFYTVASHKDLYQAVKRSTEAMHQMVMSRTGLSFNESGMLLSAVGNAEICQVVDPLLTARFSFPKEVIHQLSS